MIGFLASHLEVSKDLKKKIRKKHSSASPIKRCHRIEIKHTEIANTIKSYQRIKIKYRFKRIQ